MPDSRYQLPHHLLLGSVCSLQERVAGAPALVPSRLLVGVDVMDIMSVGLRAAARL